MLTPMQTIKKKRAEAVNRIISNGTCPPNASMWAWRHVKSRPVQRGDGGLPSGYCQGLTDVYLSQKGCAGRCNLEPTVRCEEGKIPVKYGRVTPQRARDIIERHLKKGEVIADWVI